MQRNYLSKGPQSSKYSLNPLSHSFPWLCSQHRESAEALYEAHATSLLLFLFKQQTKVCGDPGFGKLNCANHFTVKGPRKPAPSGSFLCQHVYKRAIFLYKNYFAKKRKWAYQLRNPQESICHHSCHCE